MAFKIELKSTVIPFTINGLDFEIDGSDEKLKAFNTKYVQLLTEVKEEKSNLLENENKYQDFVQEAMDELLGTGSFARLYEQTPSVIILFDALNQIVDSLMLSILSRVEVESSINTLTNKKKKSALNWLVGKK